MLFISLDMPHIGTIKKRNLSHTPKFPTEDIPYQRKISHIPHESFTTGNSKQSTLSLKIHGGSKNGAIK